LMKIQEKDIYIYIYIHIWIYHLYEHISEKALWGGNGDDDGDGCGVCLEYEYEVCERERERSRERERERKREGLCLLVNGWSGKRIGGGPPWEKNKAGRGMVGLLVFDSILVFFDAFFFTHKVIIIFVNEKATFLLPLHIIISLSLSLCLHVNLKYKPTALKRVLEREKYKNVAFVLIFV